MSEIVSKCPITELIASDEEACQYHMQTLDEKHINWESSKVIEIKEGYGKNIERQGAILRMGDHLYGYDDVTDLSFQVADSIDSFFGRQTKGLSHSALTVSSIDLFGDYGRKERNDRNTLGSTFSRSSIDLSQWKRPLLSSRPLEESNYDQTISHYDIDVDKLQGQSKLLYDNYERDSSYSRKSTYSLVSQQDETESSVSSICVESENDITKDENDFELSETETIKEDQCSIETTSSEASTVILSKAEKAVPELRPTPLLEEVVPSVKSNEEDFSVVSHQEQEIGRDVTCFTNIAPVDHHLNDNEQEMDHIYSEQKREQPEQGQSHEKEIHERRFSSCVEEIATPLNTNEEILHEMTPSNELEEVPIHGYVSNIPSYLMYMENDKIMDNNQLQEALDASENLILQVEKVQKNMLEELQKYSDNQEVIYEKAEDSTNDTVEDGKKDKVYRARCVLTTDSPITSVSSDAITTATVQSNNCLSQTDYSEEQNHSDVTTGINPSKHNENIYEEIADNIKTPKSSEENVHLAVSYIYEEPRDKEEHYDIPADSDAFIKYDEVSNENLTNELNEENTISNTGKVENFETVKAIPCEVKSNEVVSNKIPRHMELAWNKSNEASKGLDDVAKLSPTTNTKESLSNVLDVHRYGKPIGSPTFQRLQEIYTPEDVSLSNSNNYEMNKYDENDVVKQVADEKYNQNLAKQIRRMSKNNQWSDRGDEPNEIFKITKRVSMESAIHPNCSSVATKRSVSQPLLTSPESCFMVAECPGKLKISTLDYPLFNIWLTKFRMMCTATTGNIDSSEKLSSSRTIHRTINTPKFIV
uniref:PH domain-containing protein n=1 Tax=Heterorhabditis bacteriophora TaxID=37862 RepID=A0A1I7XDK9_HETBA